MKKAKKIICFVLIFFLSPMLVYAAKYKLTGDQILPDPQISFKNELSNSYLTTRAENACYAWWDSVQTDTKLNNGVLDIDISGTNNKYAIRCYTDTSPSAPYGFTGFMTDDGILIYLNTASNISYPQDYVGKNAEAWISVISHEFGHVFGLDDLGFFDTRDAIMSEYIDREDFYNPTTNDLDGVKDAYDL